MQWKTILRCCCCCCCCYCWRRLCFIWWFLDQRIRERNGRGHFSTKYNLFDVCFKGDSHRNRATNANFWLIGQANNIHRPVLVQSRHDYKKCEDVSIFRMSYGGSLRLLLILLPIVYCKVREIFIPYSFDVKFELSEWLPVPIKGHESIKFSTQYHSICHLLNTKPIHMTNIYR